MTIYNEAVTKINKLLKERNICWYSRKVHEQQCYAELREYLHSVDAKYSCAEARKWLKVVKPHEFSGGFWANGTILINLEELLHTGTILHPRW